MKHLKSLRDLIGALGAIGPVQSIDVEVDWNLEIGAVIRRSYEVRAPAPLFNKIKGTDDGFRVFGAPGGLGGDTRTRRCSPMAAGLSQSGRGCLAGHPRCLGSIR